MKKLLAVLSSVAWLLSVISLFAKENDIATYYLVLALLLRYVTDQDDPRQKCNMCDDGTRSECEYCGSTGYELHYQDVPVCPHCGATQSIDELYETVDIQCDECKGWMEVEVNYTTADYTTRKTDAPDVKERKRQEERAYWEAQKAEKSTGE